MEPTTITQPFLVILYQRNEMGKITPARRQFTSEAHAEEFAVALLGADAPEGIIIGSSLFRMNEDGTMNPLNEWEF